MTATDDRERAKRGASEDEMTDTDLAFAPALEQARMIREKEISPVELTELYLRRIDDLDRTTNAFITVVHDKARAWAKEAEARVGDDDAPAFNGVPISIKDNVNTAGIPTSQGVGAWRDMVPAQDAEIVTRIKRAGFTILGKTNLPELATMGFTEPAAFGACRNPWNPERTPGGSSGGAAAALAAGMCPISQGSDGGGSIRLPSAWSGVFGLKPSRGRISRAPAADNLYSIYGPIARTVADAAALLDVMSGPAIGDGWWAPPPERPFLEEARREPGRLRIAFISDHENETAETQPEVKQAVEDAAKLLESLGHDVVRDAPRYADPNIELWDHPVASAFASFVTAMVPDLPPVETLDPINQLFIEIGKDKTIRDVMMAELYGHAETRRIVRFWHDGPYDILLTPSVGVTAPRIGEFVTPDDPMRGFMAMFPKCPWTGIWNMTGQPAASVPWGFDAENLPLAIQLVARPADEAILLRLCAQLEAERPWNGVRPPVS